MQVKCALRGCAIFVFRRTLTKPFIQGVFLGAGCCRGGVRPLISGAVSLQEQTSIDDQVNACDVGRAI